MKWIVWTLCLLCPLSALPDENLSKQECIELADKGKGDLALNSLRMSFVEQSESEEWNEDEFAMTFMLLYNVYSEHGMLREKSDLCSYAMRTFNRKSPERNTEFSRMLWRMGGRVRVDLKDYDSTISYLRQAQWMYEDKSIYDSGYFTILADIGWCCLYKKDYANARLYLDEAEDINVEAWDIDDLCELIYKGRIQDAKTVASLLAYKNLKNTGVGDYCPGRS